MENWKDIPGFVGFYQASDTGRIRSVQRQVRSKDGKTRNSPSRVLSIARFRYEMVIMSAEGKRSTGLVHRLVCAAFHGAPWDGAHAAHRDGNRYNNLPENLYWATAKQNCADRTRHGTWVHGTRVNTNKLSEDDVRAIIARVAGGELPRVIALDYGIHRSSIHQMVRGDTWKHLTR